MRWWQRGGGAGVQGLGAGVGDEVCALRSYLSCWSSRATHKQLHSRMCTTLIVAAYSCACC